MFARNISFFLGRKSLDTGQLCLHSKSLYRIAMFTKKSVYWATMFMRPFVMVMKVCRGDTDVL